MNRWLTRRDSAALSAQAAAAPSAGVCVLRSLHRICRSPANRLPLASGISRQHCALVRQLPDLAVWRHLTLPPDICCASMLGDRSGSGQESDRLSAPRSGCILVRHCCRSAGRHSVQVKWQKPNRSTGIDFAYPFIDACA